MNTKPSVQTVLTRAARYALALGEKKTFGIARGANDIDNRPDVYGELYSLWNGDFHVTFDRRQVKIYRIGGSRLLKSSGKVTVYDGRRILLKGNRSLGRYELNTLIHVSERVADDRPDRSWEVSTVSSLEGIVKNLDKIQEKYIIPQKSIFVRDYE